MGIISGHKKARDEATKVTVVVDLIVALDLEYLVRLSTRLLDFVVTLPKESEESKDSKPYDIYVAPIDDPYFSNGDDIDE